MMGLGHSETGTMGLGHSKTGTMGLGHSKAVSWTRMQIADHPLPPGHVAAIDASAVK